MKHTVVTVLFLLFTLNSFAQEKEDVLDIVAKKTCEYLNSEEVKDLKGDELAMKMGLKMFALYGEYKKELNKAGVTFDPNDAAESGRKLGERIGMVMVKFCPDALMALAGGDKGLVDIDEEPKEEFKSIEGTIKSVDGDDIVTLAIKDVYGKTQKFIWLSNFKGSDRLIEATKVKGIYVKVFYKDIEVYSPKLKEYVTRKQITQIEYP
jgi:hypothetical protein